MRKYLLLRSLQATMLVFLVLMSGKGWGQANHIVISQVYGGGGNSGASYNRDYVEIFNPSGNPINITGWKVQYASAAGSFSDAATLNGTINSGSYFLIGLASGSNGANLPTLNGTGTTNMSATAGKVRLINDLGNQVDLLGFGSTASAYEGSGPAAALSGNVLAYFRKNQGCLDTNDNAADFTTSNASPRNSTTPNHFCASAPTTSTIPPTTITAQSADPAGEVTNDGGATVSERGIAYGTSANSFPDTATVTGDPIFTGTLSNLSFNTQYFYHAFATNSAGTGRGDTLSFYTLAEVPGAPTVSNPSTSTLDVAVDGNGNPAHTVFAIQVDGSQYVQADGTLGATETWQSAATWATTTVTGLTPNTTYTFSVKARNGDNLETSFGSTAQGTTLSASAPLLSTTPSSLDFGSVCIQETAVESFNLTGANMDGTDVSLSAVAGYEYALSAAGPFTTTLTLTAFDGTATDIFVRFSPVAASNYNGAITISGGGASAITVDVTGAGINTPPAISANAATAITATTASVAGNITDDGCSAVTAFGIEYSTASDLSGSSNIPGGALTGGSFTINLSNLLANTTYYYHFYATNSGGTSYSSVMDFTTAGLTAPVATAATNVMQNNFTANWNAVEGAESYRLDVSASSTFSTVTSIPRVAEDLFFSEYVEGSSNNKYLEIYNGTGASIDLSNYEIRLFTNGAASATNTESLTGTLANGETIVFRNSSANLSGTTHFPSSSTLIFNGDDALGLFKISTGTYVDIFGVIGNDPGSSWSSTSNNTVDKTLRRKSNIIKGVTSNPSGTGPSAFTTLEDEWDQFNIDVVSGLGNHTFTPGTTTTTTPSFLPAYENLTVNGTSQPVTGLDDNTTYYYRVRAYSPTSTSGNSNVITVTTLVNPATAEYVSNGPVSTSSEANWQYNDGSGMVAASTPPAATNSIVVNSGDHLSITNDFTVGSGATFTLNGTMEVLPTASFTVAGAADFNSQSVTLRSDASGTARLGQITGTLAGASNVTVERYIPAAGRRAWRLLAAPLSATGAPTIFDSWQEGGTAGPFGMHITKPAAPGTDGYDASTIAARPSIFYYDGTDLVAPDNTNATPVTNHGAAYFAFVRGDRNINVNNNSATSNTTLRMTGTINQGDVSGVGISSTTFSLIPNPYPSAVDFEALQDANPVGSTFYVWDATIGQFGAYRTVVRQSAGIYESTPSTANDNTMRYIMSGQAFFVPGSHTATFTESMKSDGVPAANPFRTSAGTEQMLINLGIVNGSTVTVADAVRAKFSNNYSNAIDANDIQKLGNFNENLAILREGNNLAVETRDLVEQADTIFLKLWNTGTRNYRLDFNLSNFDVAANLEAYLVDAFLQTTTLLNMDGNTAYDFSVTANTASADTDRFMVVFKTAGVLPVKFLDIKASGIEQKVKVEWKVAGGSEARHFEVERSANGTHFTAIGTVENNQTGSFAFTDAAPVIGTNFYRIKAVAANGGIEYSKVVKVALGTKDAMVSIYPNPVKDGKVNIQMVNQPKGRYSVRLINQAGQVLDEKVIEHIGGSMNQVVDFSKAAPSGLYHLRITGQEGSNVFQVLFK